ncbi:two-component sensor histidine kinase [Spirochaetia bacterium]|nr:two-component sensor histidine kinase [Spirochaetia bacterium]
MKTTRTRPKYVVINVGGLVLIYVLLCILTIVFSRSFFSDTLQDGRVPGTLNLIVFLTIPVVLLIFLAVSILSLFRDIIARRAGSKFKARLLAYFIVIVAFSAAPVTIITGISVTEILHFWRSINTNAAAAADQNFALDAYSLHMERLESLIKRTDFSPFMVRDGGADGTMRQAPPQTAEMPGRIAAVQDFRLLEDGTWVSWAFTGDEARRLQNPPLILQGFIDREMPRDADVIRYAVPVERTLVRIVSYSLGEGFDAGVEAIENEMDHFQIIDSIMANLQPLLIFFYGVFFFPSLLMTLIIAISFTRRVTQPIVELTEATRRVAEGDFSIQILARRGDELGLLIRSFNAMVQDLEKSRAALIKTEKISIWQNMAQQLAHEIKNPLTPIKLSAERVLRRWRNEPERVGEILESSMLAIIQETEGLSTLLTEFRTLSRPMEPSQSWTRLRELVTEITTPYGSSHPGIQFDIEHVGEDVSVKIDRHRIAQVLTNLIINAIDAMDGKGLIDIRTDLVKKRESQYCRLSIKDTGKGISKDEASHIFTPYFTTKESGTGLGLPIVERIVNDHGGAIWFNSAEGLGTTFFIDLPLDTSPSIQALVNAPKDGK